MVRGHYSDGQTAASHEVTLHVHGGNLVIAAVDGDVLARWPVTELRQMQVSGAGGARVLGRMDDDARVSFHDRGLLDLISIYAPDMKKGLHKRQKFGPVLLALVGAAIAFPLIFFVLLPRMAETLAVFITPETEVAMGDRTYPQLVRVLSLGDEEALHRCVAPEGSAVLAEMTTRMEDRLDLPFPLRVEVWDHPLVNALAMPGGRIVLFRGFLEEVTGPDAVAGVLAHEIGHVANRDSVRLGLRAAGSAGVLGLVLGDFAGGAAALAIAEAMLSASYTREAETAADEFALDQLAALDIPAFGMAEFFEQLAPDEPHDHAGALSHFATHPDIQGRAENARARSTGVTPALSDEDWAAMLAICDQTEAILAEDDWGQRFEDIFKSDDVEKE